MNDLAPVLGSRFTPEAPKKLYAQYTNLATDVIYELQNAVVGKDDVTSDRWRVWDDRTGWSEWCNTTGAWPLVRSVFYNGAPA